MIGNRDSFPSRRVARSMVHPHRDARILFALGGAAGAAILPFFALLLRDRGLAPDEIGFVLAVSSVAAVVAAPVWSHAADERLGTARTLGIASVASAATALVLLMTGSSLWAIFVVVAAMGVAQAPGTALGDALALGVLGKERETEYGTIRLWASVGWGVAVIAFGAWFERAGLGPVLPAYAVLTLVYAAVTLRFPSARPERAQRAASRLGSVGEAFRSSPRLPAFLVGLFLVAVATSASWTFVPLRIASQGGGPFLIGLAAGVQAFLEIPFFRASAGLSERFGLRTLYVSGAAIYLAQMATWTFIENPVAVAAVKIAGGAGFGLIYAALVVITGRLVPERLRNTGQALLQVTTMGIAPIIGSAVGGLIYARIGPPALFAGAATCTVAGAGVVWATLSDPAFSGASARSEI